MRNGKEFAASPYAISMNDDNYYLVQSLILKLIHQLIRQAPDIETIAQSWDDAVKTFSETDSLNLDRKQALLTIINNLCKRI